MRCTICEKECADLAPDERFCGDCGHAASEHAVSSHVPVDSPAVTPSFGRPSTPRETYAHTAPQGTAHVAPEIGVDLEPPPFDEQGLVVSERRRFEIPREYKEYDNVEVGVKAVTFSPDGRYFLSGVEGALPEDRKAGRNGTVLLWDVATGRVLRHYTGHKFAPEAVAFSPDSRHVFSCGDHLYMWELRSGREVRRLRTHFVFRATFSRDGRYVLVGYGEHKGIHLWDVQSGQPLRRFEGEPEVACLAVSPNGRIALSGSYSEGSLRVYDATTGREMYRLEGDPEGVTSVAFLPDGRLALSGGLDGTVRLWDIEGGRQLHCFGRDMRHLWDTKGGQYDNVACLAVSPAGRHAIGGRESGTFHVWDLKARRELRRFEGAFDFERGWGQKRSHYEGHPNSVSSVAFSADGRYALSAGSGHGGIRLWEFAG